MPKMLIAPSTMKMMIAATLMKENQYSTVPKPFTERELTNSNSAANASDHSQIGEPGNQ